MPKTAGTSLAAGLEAAMAPTRPLRGLDRSLFGSFQDYDSFDDRVRRTVFLSPDALPRDAGLVIGHFAYTTLRQASPSGRIFTILREPVTRLLSHWLYWRQIPDAELDGWAGWANYVRKASLSLADFLGERSIAPQTDNLMARMLLWPHQRVPPDDFIDPRDDRRLFREAWTRLAGLDFADIIESDAMTHRFEIWLQRPFVQFRINETSTIPTHLRSALHHELTSEAYSLLEKRTRLDLRLWRRLASRHLGAEAVERMRQRSIVSAVARYASLMS